jgi:hypothetical protein
MKKFKKLFFKESIEYLVQRCVSKEGCKLFPTVHGAGHEDRTFCGKEINSNWFITRTNESWKPIKETDITCKDCLKELHKNKEI